MDSDKVFALYAAALVAGVATLLTACVKFGIATPPATGPFLEHVALGLCIRTAYKSFAGFDWFFAIARAAGFITIEPSTSPPMDAAHA